MRESILIKNEPVNSKNQTSLLSILMYFGAFLFVLLMIIGAVLLIQ